MFLGEVVNGCLVSGFPLVVPQGGMTIASRYFPEVARLTARDLYPLIFVLMLTLSLGDSQYQHMGLSSQSTYFRRGLQQIQPRPLASNRDELYRLISGQCANNKTYGYDQSPGRSLAQFEQLKLVATLRRDYDIEQVDVRKEWAF